MKWLIQQAYGRDYFAMLDITQPIHEAACVKHCINYAVHRQWVNADPFSDTSQAQMYLVHLILSGKFSDGDIVALLDADALWKNSDVDICDALPVGYDIAIKGSGYVNGGFVVQRISKQLMDFWRSVLYHGPVNPQNMQIDPAIHAQIRSSQLQIKIHSLSDKWNWFDQNNGFKLAPDCARNDAIVLHWQSMNRVAVIEAIKNEMAVA